MFLGARTQSSPGRRFKRCKIVFGYIIRVFQQNGSYHFHPNGQKFIHLNMTSEKPSEASGNCGVLPLVFVIRCASMADCLHIC